MAPSLSIMVCYMLFLILEVSKLSVAGEDERKRTSVPLVLLVATVGNRVLD